jgi:hypothetical protein
MGSYFTPTGNYGENRTSFELRIRESLVTRGTSWAKLVAAMISSAGSE